MENVKTKILQYPRGDNAGGVLDIDFCPTISTSGFQHNVWVIIYEKKSETDIARSQPRLKRKDY